MSSNWLVQRHIPQLPNLILHFLYIIKIHTYHLLGISRVGGSERTIFSTTLIGLISWWGGFISASSIKVIPALQISAYITQRERGGERERKRETERERERERQRESERGTKREREKQMVLLQIEWG